MYAVVSGDLGFINGLLHCRPCSSGIIHLSVGSISLYFIQLAGVLSPPFWCGRLFWIFFCGYPPPIKPAANAAAPVGPSITDVGDNDLYGFVVGLGGCCSSISDRKSLRLNLS